MLRDLNVSTSGRRVCGTPKLGVRGAAIPSTGQHGPSIIYPSLSLPADANKFSRARILTWPAQGVLRVYEDGSLDYDGTGVFEPQTFTFQLYENGVAIGGVLTATLDTGGTYEVYGVSVTPATVSVAGAAQTTLQAAVWGTEGVSQAVTWTATEGTVSSAGVFTAPAATTTDRTITVTARSVVDVSKSGVAVVTVPASQGAPQPTVTAVTVSPAGPTVVGAATQQFTATVVGTNSPSQSVVWTTSAGTINSSGLFTAPAATGSAQTITVTATSVVDGARSGSATVTVPAIAVGYTQYPDVADVRAGVRYGASGELTGTMAGGGIGIMLGRGIGVTLDGGLIIGVTP